MGAAVAVPPCLGWPGAFMVPSAECDVETALISLFVQIPMYMHGYVVDS